MWKMLLALLVSVTVWAAPHPEYETDLIQQAISKNLAQQKQWLKLLHYKKSWGSYKSEADGETFFLAKDGKGNPEAELIAAIKAFFLEAPEKDPNEHAQCKFPARYKWLKEQLRFDDSKVKPRLCLKYADFRESVSAKSASIIFSSYYLNNPASAFGHSLLRLNKNDLAYDGKRYELLDNGINYAAVVTQDNPIIYAFMGLTGMFKGTFTRVPYYFKVREYNDFESRDLWVYDLNMTQAQVDKLVDHIWELGSTYFDYWYLTENCSYHILTALEAAMPELELSDKLPMVVVPADTIKVITEEKGLVADVRFRPSVRSTFLARIENMPQDQVDIVRALSASRDLSTVPDTLNDADKAAVFDAAIDQVDFKRFKLLVNEPEGEDAQWKQKLLVSRSKIPVTSPEVTVAIPKDETPHIGHGVMRAGFEGGATKDFGGFGSAQFRFALHDLLDPKSGYPEYSQIEFFNTRVRYLPQPGRVWLEDFALFRVISLNPLTTFDRQLSWKVKLGATTVRDQGCDHCLAGQFEIGGGYAVDLLPRWTAFLSVDAEAHLTPSFRPRAFFRPGVGPSILMRTRFSESFISVLTASYRYRIWTNEKDYATASAEFRYALSRELSLNLKTAVFPDTWETSAGVYLYF